MIAVKLRGRLGNQLFQYAFAYATAKKLNTSFYLDKRFAPTLLSKYFIVGKDKFQWLDDFVFSIKGFKNLFSSYFKLAFYSKIEQVLNLKEIEFANELNPIEEMLKIANQKIYSGFFQSELYFENCRTEIKLQFCLKKEHIRAFEKIYSSLILPQEFNLIVIHIRRTDYINHHYDLPLSYFHKAIAKIDNPINFYVLISDDPKFVAKEFDYLSNKYISSNNEIIDFQFLMNADSCILSNSSFSWWGAYLNQKKAHIIAPEYWLGLQHKIEEPSHILLKEWEHLSP